MESGHRIALLAAVVTALIGGVFTIVAAFITKPGFPSSPASGAPTTVLIEGPGNSPVTPTLDSPSPPRTPPSSAPSEVPPPIPEPEGIGKIEIADFGDPPKVGPSEYKARPGKNADFAYVVRVTSTSGQQFRDGCYYKGVVLDRRTNEALKIARLECGTGTFAAVPVGSYRISVEVTLDSGARKTEYRDFSVVS